MRCLVLDGDGLDRTRIAVQVRQHFPHAAVLEAADLSQLEAALADGPVDVVLTEMSLPGIDTPELLQALGERLSRVPVILVTDEAREAQAVRAVMGGLGDYVLKSHLLRLPVAIDRVRQSQEYRLLFDSNPHPMWVYDVETLAFLAVNDAAVAHYGYSRDEFLGMTITDIRPPEEIPSLLQAVAHQLREGLTASGIWRHRKKDGTVLFVEITSSNLSFAGRPARLILAHDVTERQMAEAALRESEEQLRQSQKMEAVGRLAGGVAHDFNNLLTVITGYVSLSTSLVDPSSRLRDHLQEIGKAAERAASLTRQLLAFSRRQILQPQILDLNDVVSDTEKMLLRLIGEDVELITLLSRGLEMVKADPGQMEQVLLNMVVNAREAMPQGGRLTIETANVSLDVGQGEILPGRYVMLSIADTGRGMDAETISRIFEPFYSTKKLGTGLGLAMVYGVVKQSGGHIVVSSEPGRGTLFKVFLPRAEAGVPRVEAQEAAVRPGKETILVVEDESAVRDLSCRILRGHGYTVYSAPGAAEALEVFERARDAISLLVTDVIMPQTSGSTLAEWLRERRPGIKVLFMSGYTDDAIVRHGVRSSSVAFLQKPFLPDMLLRKVREVLDQPIIH